jgi:DNA replication protein DnaC
MLQEQTIAKLNKMKLFGMAQETLRQRTIDEIASLSFDERFSLLVDMEETSRENRRLKRLLTEAKLRENACIEDIDFSSSRGLDRSLVMSLATCTWIEKCLNVLLTGPTGAGKTFIACALGNAACRQGYGTFYARASRLFDELKIARTDGTYVKLLNKLAKAKLLIIDDWGINALTDIQRNDILEIIEDRYKLRSTIIISQIPIERWHDVIGNPTIADAVLGRIVHNAYKINLEGEDSMRKNQQLLD